MSVMEKRLQLLLDEHRYSLVSAEAERSGRSVAAVIRQSIDHHFADHDAAARRAAAAAAFLEMTQDPEEGEARSAEDISRSLDADFEKYVLKKAGR
ncbi:hypothetical protein BH23ACT6_BH23ACT6_08040 [soil metagenome]